jgi:hypothetical protein
MTQTIAPSDPPAPEAPRPAWPAIDADAVRAIGEAAGNVASRDMPGRQREIGDCVNKILAKVDPSPAAG